MLKISGYQDHNGFDTAHYKAVMAKLTLGITTFI